MRFARYKTYEEIPVFFFHVPLDRAAMMKRWAAFFVLIFAADALAGDAFDYPFFRSETARPAARPNNKQSPPWRRFYREDHDFRDYSMHYTRTDPHSRSSANEPPPSGPYFAYELKEYYHKRNPQEVPPSIYPTSWNVLDHDGNELSGLYQRPVVVTQQPKLTNNPAIDAWIQQQHLGLLHHQMKTKPLIAYNQNFDMDSEYPPQDRPDRPMRKPLPGKRPNKKKKRPILEVDDDYPSYQKHPSHHPNYIDKVSEGPQSIASAYPNGALGTLSLLAGVAWYLINRSATPVVKMRQHSDGNSQPDEEDPFGVNHILDYWSESLRHSDCQQRAVCEIVAQSPLLSSAAQWSRDLYE